MVLIGAGVRLLLTVALTAQHPQADGDPVPVVRRVAATAQLAAQEYRNGVQGGRVVAQAEVGEARLFLVEARRSAALLRSLDVSSTVRSART